MASDNESEHDKAAQAAMLSRATMSISVLEKGFIRNGSGRYFVLRTTDLDPVIARGPSLAPELNVDQDEAADTAS